MIEQFKTPQMVDVHVPTTDGRELVPSRYPDGHFKLPHLWPPKLPRAGQWKL